METRTINHANHTDTETLINGVWAVTACNCKLETKMANFFNGYTDSQNMKEWRAVKSLKNFATNLYLRSTSESDADKMHNLLVSADYEQRTVEQKRQAAEVENDMQWLDVRVQTDVEALGKLPNDEDGTYPSPYISGGEVVYPSETESNDNEIPF